MEIRRTGNAGVLLNLDDVSILLDGVCRQVLSYLPTPPAEREKLKSQWPDVVAFTHIHEDHFDLEYARGYSQATGRPILSTTQAEQLLPEKVWTQEVYTAGRVRLSAVKNRHMGHWGQTTEHQSFVIEGSECVWFLGDASPLQMKQLSGYRKPDVLILPYPYVSTPAALKIVAQYLPCKIVLLHLPLKDQDPDGIWQGAEAGLCQLKPYLYIPEVGETIQL